MLNEASANPTIKAGQNPSPNFSANANGMKNGSPNGTKISVSRANLDVVGKSLFCCHRSMMAKMLSIGSVRMNAPRRGFLWATCVTIANVTDANIQRTIPHINTLHRRGYKVKLPRIIHVGRQQGRKRSTHRPIAVLKGLAVWRDETTKRLAKWSQVELFVDAS